MECQVPFTRLHKQTILIGMVSFLMSFSSSMVISCAMDFTKHIGAAASIVVLGRMIGEGSGYIGRFIIGFISDIIGDRRNFLLLGYGAIIVIKPLFILSSYEFLSEMNRILIYTVANVSDKFFGSIRDPIRDAWLADHIGKEDLSANLSIRRVFSYSGTILGALSAFVLIKRISYRSLFTIAFIPAFLGVTLLYKYIKNPPQLKKIDHHNGIFSEFMSDMKSGKKLFFLSILFLGIFCLFLGKINEFSLWFTAERSGIHESNSLLFMIFYLSSCFGSIILSFFVSRFSPYLIILFASLLMIFINTMIPMYLSYWFMIISTIYYGIYGAFLDILTTAITLNKFHDTKWKATVMSFLNLVIGIAYTFSGLFNKHIIEKHGLTMSFKLSVYPVCVGGIILVFMYFLFGKENKKIS